MSQRTADPVHLPAHCPSEWVQRQAWLRDEVGNQTRARVLARAELQEAAEHERLVATKLQLLAQWELWRRRRSGVTTPPGERSHRIPPPVVRVEPLLPPPPPLRTRSLVSHYDYGQGLLVQSDVARVLRQAQLAFGGNGT